MYICMYTYIQYIYTLYIYIYIYTHSHTQYYLYTVYIYCVYTVYMIILCVCEYLSRPVSCILPLLCIPSPVTCVSNVNIRHC